jgi:hypothetical protein
MVTNHNRVNGIYTGECFVFDSSGGFTIESSLPDVKLKPTEPLSQYDVTNAIQMLFSVRRFNDQLGIIKDESNNKILEVLNYDISSEVLQSDSVTISSEEFLNCINNESIISMGDLSTLYSDFNYTVMEYFKDPTGLFSLFSYYNILQLTNGVFDSKSFFNMLNGITFDIKGAYVTDLSGYFTVNNVNDHLRYVCDTNVFNNRTDVSGNIFNILDGFMEGDLIFIPKGMSITLSVSIDYKTFENGVTHFLPLPNKLNNDPSLNYVNNVKNTSKVTSYSTTGISQTYTVPILIILSNKDTFNINNFCQNWIDVTSSTIGTRKWIAVSVSANGQFQCVVNSYGDVYISNNYGNTSTWTLVYNIGTAPEFDVNTSLSNSIAVSANGEYVTACNGSQIFVSNNYGESMSWKVVKTFTTTQIYVSISLNGQYQTVLSCGNNMYYSSDYGETWNTLTDTNSVLYNSLNMFQYASISVSFTGMYQTIVCEHIYVSSNYGLTWNEMDNIIDGLTNDENYQHNWTGVSVSSEGQYQTAVDSGGYLYTSSDYGNSWKYITNGIRQQLWTGVSISANGKFQTALEFGGSIYFSTDYGVSWNITTSTVVQNRNFQAISISANGQYQTAVEYGGAVYISNLV